MRNNVNLFTDNLMDIPSVILFTVHLLQNLINKQWIGALPEDKTEVRRFLNEYLLSHHKKLPGYIRNKLVKVIVDIGRVDWPHFYPNFLSNIVEVSRHKLRNGIIIRWKMILAFVNAPYAIILQKIWEDNNYFLSHVSHIIYRTYNSSIKLLPRSIASLLSGSSPV